MTVQLCNRHCKHKILNCKHSYVVYPILCLIAGYLIVIATAAFKFVD